MSDFTIWKYQLRPVDEQMIQIPAGAQILCVQIQFGLPCIWALVDQTAPLQNREFVTIGTGGKAPEPVKLRYIGTGQAYGGELVFHVFEKLQFKEVA